METFIQKLIETSIMGGILVYTLHTLMKPFIGNVMDTNKEITVTLKGISETLTRMDLRLGEVEKRVEHLEGGVKV